MPLRLSSVTAAAGLLVCWQYVAGHRARPLRGSLRVLRASGSVPGLLRSVAGDLRAGSSSSSCRRSGRRSGSRPGAAPRGIVSGSACAGAAGSAAAAFRAARCGLSGSALEKCGRASCAAAVGLSVHPVRCCAVCSAAEILGRSSSAAAAVPLDQLRTVSGSAPGVLQGSSAGLSGSAAISSAPGLPSASSSIRKTASRIARALRISWLSQYAARRFASSAVNRTLISIQSGFSAIGRPPACLPFAAFFIMVHRPFSVCAECTSFRVPETITELLFLVNCAFFVAVNVKKRVFACISSCLVFGFQLRITRIMRNSNRPRAIRARKLFFIAFSRSIVARCGR